MSQNTAIQSFNEDFQQRCLDIQLDDNGIWTLKITEESWNDALIYAKKLEKQQIANAWNQRAIGFDGEEYYKYTYGVQE
jgi:hypothetical protein